MTISVSASVSVQRFSGVNEARAQLSRERNRLEHQLRRSERQRHQLRQDLAEQEEELRQLEQRQRAQEESAADGEMDLQQEELRRLEQEVREAESRFQEAEREAQQLLDAESGAAEELKTGMERCLEVQKEKDAALVEALRLFQARERQVRSCLC